MTMQDILLMRQNPSSLYFNFIEYFISSVIGKNYYKYHKRDKLMSQYVTVSDEALAILIFENNIDTWIDMANNGNTKKSRVNRKYTNGGASQGEIGSSCRYQGWSSEGIIRFNELFDLVKIDRLSAAAKPFEESFQKFCIDGGISGKSKKSTAPLYEVIEVRHELWTEENQHRVANYNDSVTPVIQPIECVSGVSIVKVKKQEGVNDSDEDENPYYDNIESIGL